METPEDNESQEMNKEMLMAMLQMQPVDSTDEQKLPPHPNAVLTDLVMQMQRPDMRIKQINGQRLCGPPSDHVGPPPPKGSEIFVGRIPNHVFELELLPIFEQVGKVFEMRILMNFSKNNRGYGFVQYYTPEAADKAVALLNNFEIRPNRRLGVSKSVDNCRLYISDIPPYKTGDEIFSELNRADVLGVARVIATSGGGCGGVALIDFENHKAAAVARRSMLLRETRLWGKSIRVEWALPEPETAILFVRKLSEQTTGKSLEDLFNANSGNGVRLVRKMEDTAYISFDTPAHAEQARDALDNSTVDGSIIDVLAVHGREEMIPKECDVELLNRPDTGYPVLTDDRQRVLDHGMAHEAIPCNILGCQEFQSPTFDANQMIPAGETAPLPFLNTGYPFPPFPGFSQGPNSCIPSMMPTEQHQTAGKARDFNDLDNFERWLSLNG